MKDDYTPEEIELINAAIDAANGVLARMWNGKGPRYFVSYIELSQQELKGSRWGEKWVVNPSHYLIDERES